MSVPNPQENPPPLEPKKDSTPLIASAALGALLVASNGYFFFKANRLQDDVRDLRSAMKSELISVQNATDAANAKSDQAIAELRQQMHETGAKSAQAVVQANNAAKRFSDRLVRQLADQQTKMQQTHQVLTAQLGEMRQVATQTQDKVSNVANDVTSVRTEVLSTRSDLDRTVSDLRSVRGDLGIQSGLIATNARELAVLRSLGERDYTEFQIARTRNPQRISSDIALTLKKSDPRRNRFTIEVIADDKRVEKKDRGVNEPVQFYMARARMPYEIVINEVRPDRIVGYLSAPKVKTVLTSQAGRP